MRILSCVPKQSATADSKLKWIRSTIKKNEPDILVTPQEFFGGAFSMPTKISFTFKELFPQLKKIAKTYKCALVVGVLEAFPKSFNKEAIWFIDEGGEFLGALYKIALPRYDHVCTKGYGNVEPETEWENRFKVFELRGLRVSGMFCWEVFSDILWSGLALLKPDIVFSLIKFGVNSWPQVEKKKGKQVVKGFGYGSYPKSLMDELWIQRLYMANRWQVKCPIICSTNSWNIRAISLPLCGTISSLDGQADDTLWLPEKGVKIIPEKIVVDEIDRNKIRYALENKFTYKDVVGEFPPFSLAKYTMMLKINRLQDRLASGREQENVEKAKQRIRKEDSGFGLS